MYFVRIIAPAAMLASFFIVIILFWVKGPYTATYSPQHVAACKEKGYVALAYEVNGVAMIECSPKGLANLSKALTGKTPVE